MDRCFVAVCVPEPAKNCCCMQFTCRFEQNSHRHAAHFEAHSADSAFRCWHHAGNPPFEVPHRSEAADGHIRAFTVVQ